MDTSRVSRHSLLAIAVSSILLAGCTGAAIKPEGADALRARLTRLQSNSELASRAPLAFKDADIAVRNAELPQSDRTVGAHLVYLADRKVSIAEAQAENRLAVDQRKMLSEQREAMRLQARTREADIATNRAQVAEKAAGDQKQQAQSARADTLDAERNSRELQAQIDELHAQATERGLVLTLGDMLFTSGGAELGAVESTNLGKLAAFLNKYPQRTASIEGHTDNVGDDARNQVLSQRRADAVKSYLVAREGVSSSRLTALGKGEGSPIADNSTDKGRQQNRRVEVIIADVPAARDDQQGGRKFRVEKQSTDSATR